ncbi:MAG: hypothetical protein JSU65_12915 [Candidatus Zixiibacteriota bacterium]|nr:MAG: hypothetical protein JSU65_12915 [candidate division Zixibacteria bacterium]
MTEIETPAATVKDSNVPMIETPATCLVKIDNQEIKHRISSVRLDQYINKHHELQVRLKQSGEAAAEVDFDDPSNYTGFLGQSISLTITPSGGIIDQARELEFVGVVTELKLENSIDGLNTVLIIAKSPTIALDGAPQITYTEEQTASDIIGSIISNYPITRGDIESTSDTIKYSVQYNETDYEYISRLAEDTGKFAYYDGKEFRLQSSSGSSSEELVWRVSLGSFSMGLGTAPSQFGSKSWGYEDKATVSGEADSSSLRSSPSELPRVSIDASDTVYGKAGYIHTLEAADQSSLDSKLSRLVESQVGRMVDCVGESIVPAIKVGHCVQINNMLNLDGPYWVREVNHVFSESGKYHNRFVSSPLDVSFPVRSSARAVLTKLQSAVVTDLDDPDGLGRIKVEIPALNIETLWVRYLSQHAGGDHGLVCLPEIDDEVLIGWENGSPDLPIALGSVYNGVDMGPHTPDGENEVKVLLTKGGNEIRFTDTGGEEEIKITTKDGENQIVLNMSGPSITIESEGDISLKGKNVTIESTEQMDIISGAAMNVEASGDLTAESGVNVNIEASAQCNVKGATINLN